jgi:exonuclease 1
MNRVRMLIHFGITPYIIFDGDNLPSKAGTEKDRRERRKEGKRLGLELLKVGKTAQAHLELQKSVDVTPDMARMFIEELKYHNIQYVVAPYEADSQMAYLERKGIIDGVLSEDSDLLVFGVKCLITKLDKYGDCVEVNRSHFTACREVSFVGWSDADFRKMAILSGCDYLPGIGGLGLKTAHRMLRKHKTVDRLVKAAQFDGRLKVPADFMAAFDQAEKTFMYQWVFCPIANKLVHLTPLAEGVAIADMPFLGEEVPAQVAMGVARGDLYPRTKLPMTLLSQPKSTGKPLQPAQRSSSSIQTPDLKGTKSIDSFFKPRRTPLAELDPNSFTPSPSQQALLEQQRNTNSWAAVPTPLSRIQTVSALPSTAPQPPRRVISDPSGGRRSAPHPTKRLRLCSDVALDTPAAGGESVVRSQFFAASVPEPSPSLRPHKGGRRRPGQDFDLFSDDSLKEDMAEVACLEDITRQPKKKMRIFSDTITKSESQSTAPSGGSTEHSQESILTPASSFDSPEPETLFSPAISSQMEELRTKFAYKPPPPLWSRKSRASKSPAAKPPAAKSPLRRRNTEVWAPSPSPLVKGPEALPQAILPGTPPPVESEAGMYDAKWATTEAEVVVAASSPPPPMTSNKRRRSSLRGSEDLLVPDSEAESECSPRKPMFSLARFAFAG